MHIYFHLLSFKIATAISDNAEIRQYILDLKAQFTKSETINLHQISVHPITVDETNKSSEPIESNQTTFTFTNNQDAIMVDMEETSDMEPRKRSRRCVTLVRVWERRVHVCIMKVDMHLSALKLLFEMYPRFV